MGIEVKDAVRQIVNRVSPRAFTLIQSSRRRMFFRRYYGSRQGHSSSLIFDGSQDVRVLSGPFAGMKYLNETVWGPIEPKWIGCYEEELHEFVTRAIDGHYSTIIDVGSAEGYYAVGLAWRCPTARVYSYDTDFWARSQQRRLARLNNVNNLTIGAYCGWPEISKLTSDRTLVVCDIEGFEHGLLDPAQCAALERCDILVEVHSSGEFDTRSVCDTLKTRFAPSHAITEIAVGRPRATYVERLLAGRVSGPELATFVSEDRNADQLWLWLESARRPRH